MDRLTQDSIVELFKTLKLETETQRQAFLKLSSLAQLESKTEEQIFIRIEQNTSPLISEEQSNAQLA